MSASPASGTSRQREVIAEHLPAGYGLGFDVVPQGSSSETPASPSSSNLPKPEDESSLTLQGGDIHRDLFKISAGPPSALQRSKTFSQPARSTSAEEEHGHVPAIDALQQPQGFRRQYIMQRYRRLSSADVHITRDFVEFLDLYGSFAGEDLADSDEETLEEDGDEEEERVSTLPPERRPLLGRRRTSKAARKGDAGTTKTFFTTLKAFIGTGIMFLPKAFKNGGILFSSLTLVFVAIVTMIAFHLLLQCRARYGGSYGDLGREIVGPKMRAVILASITLSQLGFVCAGLVFVADNWYSLLQAVSNNNVIGTKALIAAQAAIIVPLAFIRNISKLGPAALLADVFILIGLVYIYQYDISFIASHGIHRSVELFNPNGYTLTLGASIFTFEGIGLILPIQSSMKKPHHFEPLLGVVMVLITLVYISVGALCYSTFGSDTQIEVINNFPQDSKLVNAVQFMYALAVLVGNPVQLFPAIRIIEAKIFGHHSGKKDLITKWKKNAFRTSMVAVCVGISIAGSGNLDRFVALIGSVACIPLVYLYPAYLHYRGVATSRAAKIGDVTMMVVGTICMIYSTTITVLNSFM